MLRERRWRWRAESAFACEACRELPALAVLTRRDMKTRNVWLMLLATVIAASSIGCSAGSTKTADVSAAVRTSLDQAGLKDVSVSQDREKGVVTLGGHVPADADKGQAEVIAKSIAGTQVVANQIAVVPPGVEREAKQMNSDLDDGIESNLHASLVNERLQKKVKFAVKNHVVTLSGEVESPAIRARAQEIASEVPNVQQVVNELQVKGQKATSTP
jgi:osmotically-inducible protein OsmY